MVRPEISMVDIVTVITLLPKSFLAVLRKSQKTVYLFILVQLTPDFAQALYLFIKTNTYNLYCAHIVVVKTIQRYQ